MFFDGRFPLKRRLLRGATRNDRIYLIAAYPSETVNFFQKQTAPREYDEQQNGGTHNEVDCMESSFSFWPFSFEYCLKIEGEGNWQKQQSAKDYDAAQHVYLSRLTFYGKQIVEHPCQWLYVKHE
jgi:hypothetical protein